MAKKHKDIAPEPEAAPAVKPSGVSREQFAADMAAHGVGRFAPKAEDKPTPVVEAPAAPVLDGIWHPEHETAQERVARVRAQARARGDALAK